MANEENKNDTELKPTLRIRLTISNNSDSGPSQRNFNNQEQTKHRCNHEIDFANQSSYNHQQQTSENEQTKKKKLFEIVQPHNHKSSLFINLSDTTSKNHQQQSENCLFISPDLNQLDPASPPSPSASTICSRSSSFELKQGIERSNLCSNSSNSTGNLLDDITMSQGCNFINSLMSASRHGSATDTSNRRTSSLNNLVAPILNQAMNKSPSGNHLVNASNETICDIDQTQTNSLSSNNRNIQNSDMTQPLTVEINQFNDDSDDYDSESDFDDMLSSQELEDECKRLEDEVRIWEQKVAELERKRFDDEVPRSLIDKMIDQRARLRDLEAQLYKLDLADESSMCIDFDDSKPSTSRFGSQIQPGQENTADILDAIPPSGSLQHQQYLTRASTGTDSSEYSQLPTFDQHKKHIIEDSDNRCQLYNNRLTESPNYIDFHQNNKQDRLSPVRPNHFKNDLRCSHIIAPQDSTSTGSSDSQY